MSQRIQCNDVGHRKGYIEITAGIHDGCINLETWSIREEIDLANHDVRDANFPDDGVTGNTEIELSVDQAHALIRLLEQAITKIKNQGTTG